MPKQRREMLSTLFWLLSASSAMAQGLNVVVSNEIAPSGATVQIKFTLVEPAAISSGELALNLDPTVFGGVTAIAAFSAAGDSAGYASVNGNHVDIHFASQSASMGSAAGMPLVVITVPLLATAVAGTQTAITANPTGSAWNGPQGLPAYEVSVTPGTVTVGGTLSISGAGPVSNLAEGTVVRITGSGFVSGTAVTIPAVSIASQQVVGPQEVDVTLAGPNDLGSKQIIVTNPDGTGVDFFPVPPATPLANIGDAFDGVIPLYPTASFSAGAGNFLEGATFGRVALANPGTAPVDVQLQVVSPVGTSSRTITFSIPGGGSYDNDYRSLQANGASLQVYATGPLRMLQLLGHPNYTQQTVIYDSAPFTAITPPPLALLVNSPPLQFSYYWVTGGPTPQPQSLPIYPESSLAPDVNFTVSLSTTSGGDWLSVTPTSGTTCGCSSPPTLTVTANPSGLAVGTYTGIITITPLGTQFQPAGPPVQVAVGLTVTNVPIVNQFVSGANFYGRSPQPNTFSITPDELAGPFTVNVLTDSGGNWLSATPTSGSTTPAQVTVSATPGNLGPGVYAGLVTVQGANAGIFAIASTLTVIGSGAQLLPDGVAPFAMGPGQPVPLPQTVLIGEQCPTSCPVGMSNNLPFTATVTTHSGGSWLSVSPAADYSSVTISANPAGLAPGIYTGVVTLTSSQAAPAQIPVALNIWTGPTPALVASPPAINLAAAPFSSQPLTGGVEMFAGYRQAELSAQATTSSGGNWLSITSVESTPGAVLLSIDTSHLAAGDYQGNVILSVPGQKVDVPVTLTVAPPNPSGATALVGSVVNAASGVQGALAPGEIIAIHGFGFAVSGAGGVLLRPHVSTTVPTSIQGIQVLINGQPAPILYARPNQVNAIVPYEVAGQTSATVQLLDVGPSPVCSLPVAPAAPGIFTLNSSGAGPAAVLNQDNSANGPSNPAERGSVIQLFATGIPVQGAVTGSISPGPVYNATPPVTVLIGGVNADVTYAGPAPGQVAGLVQVNAIVPESAPTGSDVPIVLGAAGQPSQATATIAVQ